MNLPKIYATPLPPACLDKPCPFRDNHAHNCIVTNNGCDGEKYAERQLAERLSPRLKAQPGAPPRKFTPEPDEGNRSSDRRVVRPGSPPLHGPPVSLLCRAERSDQLV